MRTRKNTSARLAAPALLRVFHPDRDGQVTTWLFNGHPALVHVWTPAEWASLPELPGDAQPNRDGSWTALRLG